MRDDLDRYRFAERLLAQRDALGALRILEPLLEEYGDHYGVRMLTARAYYHSAQLGRAREALSALIETDPADHYARFLLGRTLERSGRPGEARTHLRMAAAMSPEPDYVDSVARVERKLGLINR
ncbi:tetratricopeptide repeat protein [Nonomuraea soli]|uniref:Flp pilus assembly protein TadD n=1 Tax=Nonomuraea soli TaxID=1032476 RepID=A0A7W0HVP3_9ACTN|nr:tetratricopeptide repeat protein [Nonomuraea soli]MBA2896996.1 Flp pilus assembly protein TadD [Nonomuraea soli]